MFLAGVEEALTWTFTLYLMHTLSFFGRWFSPQLIPDLEKREKYGICQNIFDSFANCSCLLFVTQVEPGVAVVMNTILLLMSAGSAFSTAGYQRLLWSYAGTTLATQIIVFAYCSYAIGGGLYEITTVLSMVTTLLVSNLAKITRESVLLAVTSTLESERAQRSKTRFFMAGSHDLKQPLVAASMFVSIASDKTAEAATKVYLEKALSALAVMESQITPMMELARLDAGNYPINVSKKDITATVSSVCELLKESKVQGVLFKKNLPKKSIDCSTDHELLSRIISNVISNATKYTKSGSIEVSLIDNITFSTTLKIVDTGEGISKHDLSLVFDEFFQVGNDLSDPSKGYGLGLPVARRLCNLLGIELTISSHKGLGTTVEMLIPDTPPDSFGLGVRVAKGIYF